MLVFTAMAGSREIGRKERQGCESEFRFPALAGRGFRRLESLFQRPTGWAGWAEFSTKNPLGPTGRL